MDKEKQNKKLPFNTFRKGIIAGLLGVTLGISSFGFVGCSTGENGKDGTQWLSGTNAPVVSQGVDGDFYFDTDDYVIYQKVNGQWVSLGSIKGADGTNGTDGSNGITPTIEINDDGYWVINGVATNVKARGEDGRDGEDGTTPTISINSDGCWVINGTSTGVKAKGETPTIAINEDGYWVINGIVTDVSARGNEYGDVLVRDTLTLDYFADKKITLLGDSITVGVGSTQTDGVFNGYAKQLGEILGAEIENKGSNGTTMATNTGGVSRLNDLRNYTGTTDYFIVALGTNDYYFAKSNDVKLGTLGSTDSDTIYGAVYTYASILKEKFKGTNTKIYFMTPVYRSDTLNSTSYNGYTLRDICTAIIETCEMFDIPVLDNYYLSGIWSDTYSNDMADGVHPNDNGHAKIANSLANFLLSNYYYVEASQVRTITMKSSEGETVASVEVGKKFTLPTPTYTDKTFVKWVDEKGTAYQGGDVITMDSNKVVTEVVQYVNATATVSVYNYYGGILDSSKNSTVKVEKGSSITTSDLNLVEGYGLIPTYYTDDNFTTEFDFSSEINTNKSIYVNWVTDINCFSVSGSTINELNEDVISNVSNITKIVFPTKYYTNSDATEFSNTRTSTATTLVNVTTLGNGGVSGNAFFGRSIVDLSNSLKMLVVPEGITTIKGFFFAYNASLFSYEDSAGYDVYLPNSLSSIGSLAFVSIPVTQFIVGSSNTHYKAIEGSLFTASNQLIAYANECDNNGIYVLPSGATVAVSSFYGNKTITDLTLGCVGFTNTTGLKNLTNLSISSNVTESNAKGLAEFIACIISYTNTNLIGDNGHIYVNSETSKTNLVTALNALEEKEYNSGSVKITSSIIETLISKISVKSF